MKFSIKSLLVAATFAAALLALAFAWHRDRATLLERLKQERARAQAVMETAEMAEYQRLLAEAEVADLRAEMELNGSAPAIGD